MISVSQFLQHEEYSRDLSLSGILLNDFKISPLSFHDVPSQTCFLLA